MSCSSCQNGLWMFYGIYSSEDHCCVSLCDGESCISSPFPTTTTTTTTTTTAPPTTTTTTITTAPPTTTTTTTTTTCAPFSGSTFLQYINGQCSCPCCPCPPYNENCTTTTPTQGCAGCLEASISHVVSANIHFDRFEWIFTGCSICNNNALNLSAQVSFFVLSGQGKNCTEILSNPGYTNSFGLNSPAACSFSALFATSIWAYAGNGSYSVLMSFGGTAGLCTTNSDYCIIDVSVTVL